MSKIEICASKFEVEKFNGKGNFSLWKKRVKVLLVQHDLHKTLQEKSTKYVGMSDEDEDEMDLKAASTIHLCLADEVMYNVMDEVMATGIYMIKSFSNKLYLKRQLCCLRMKERSAVLEHLNFFNRIISELLAIDVKVDEEDKVSILLSLLPES